MHRTLICFKRFLEWNANSSQIYIWPTVFETLVLPSFRVLFLMPTVSQNMFTATVRQHMIIIPMSAGKNLISAGTLQIFAATLKTCAYVYVHHWNYFDFTFPYFSVTFPRIFKLISHFMWLKLISWKIISVQTNVS